MPPDRGEFEMSMSSTAVSQVSTTHLVGFVSSSDRGDSPGSSIVSGSGYLIFSNATVGILLPEDAGKGPPSCTFSGSFIAGLTVVSSAAGGLATPVGIALSGLDSSSRKVASSSSNGP